MIYPRFSTGTDQQIAILLQKYRVNYIRLLKLFRDKNPFEDMPADKFVAIKYQNNTGQLDNKLIISELLRDKKMLKNDISTSKAKYIPAGELEDLKKEADGILYHVAYRHCADLYVRFNAEVEAEKDRSNAIVGVEFIEEMLRDIERVLLNRSATTEALLSISDLAQHVNIAFQAFQQATRDPAVALTPQWNNKILKCYDEIDKIEQKYFTPKANIADLKASARAKGYVAAGIVFTGVATICMFPVAMPTAMVSIAIVFGLGAIAVAIPAIISALKANYLEKQQVMQPYSLVPTGSVRSFLDKNYSFFQNVRSSMPTETASDAENYKQVCPS